MLAENAANAISGVVCRMILPRRKFMHHYQSAKDEQVPSTVPPASNLHGGVEISHGADLLEMEERHRDSQLQALQGKSQLVSCLSGQNAGEEKQHDWQGNLVGKTWLVSNGKAGFEGTLNQKTFFPSTDSRANAIVKVWAVID